MSDALVAATVAGVVSLVVTFGKVLWDDRQKAYERRRTARASLDLYREPLLTAADDLGSRINNIRHDGFLGYLEKGGRERTALLGTLFRFAQLFGWTEIVHGYFGRLRFEQDESTRAVAGNLKEVSKVLANDRLDRDDEGDFTSTRLMIWREEQRAVGELMRVDGEPARCASFDSFVRDYDSRYAPWFARFAAQVDRSRTPGSDRLAEVQRLLADLVRALDDDRILVRTDARGDITEPRWAQPRMMRRSP